MAADPVAPQGSGWRAATAADPCLFCDFLAGAVAVIPWAPSIVSAAARWHEPVPVRPAGRVLFARAFLARGPPA